MWIIARGRVVHSQQYGGLGLPPVRIMDARWRRCRACAHSPAINHHRRQFQRWLSWTWLGIERGVSKVFRPFVAQVCQFRADLGRQILQVSRRNLNIQQILNQPGRLIERRDGGGCDQRFDQLWTVASLRQTLVWSVGGKNPGGNAGNDTWLRGSGEARIWF